MQDTSKSHGIAANERVRPEVTPDWVKDNKLLRFDRDIVRKFGLKGARFITYLECWLSGKVNRDLDSLKYTYDSAQVICQRTGLKPATLERIVVELVKAKFIRVKHGKKNVRCYALCDQKDYYKSRAKEKHVFALREDVDKHGEPVAILLQNLRHWAKHNKERIRLFKGRYWRHDTLKNLGWQFTGFLTKEQLRAALGYMYKQQLVEIVGFCDQNGVRHDDRFWITLLEVPPVDDYEPQNKVRPASMFTPEGARIDGGSASTNHHLLDDKTASPNDKTESENDKTAAGPNGHQVAHFSGDAGNDSASLIETSLFVPPEVAGAPSVATQVRVSTNLPQSAEPARPSASRKPAASSADSPTAGDFVHSFNLRFEQLEATVGNLTRQVHQLNLNLHLDKAKPMNRSGWLESLEDILLRIPRSDQRNFMHQFSRDRDALVKEQARASRSDRVPLNEQERQINIKRSPLDCFSHRFGDPRQLCRKCIWAKSCEIATPAEIREAIRYASVLNTPDWNVLRESDRPENVADTYRTAYREVFGTDAPDVVGKAAVIYQKAQTFKLPVRYYCLVYMSLWAKTHPMQPFYSRYLSGDQAFEMVSMVVDLCNQKFGTVLEDRLAMVLNLSYWAEDTKLWRHQPTPTERFMKGWLQVCNEQGLEDYQFQKQEVRELTGFMGEMGLSESEELLESAEAWLGETTGEKTLLHFLYHIQDKPVPEAEVDFCSLVTREDENGYDDDGFYDVTRTKAYKEEMRRKEEAERRARPDSGHEFVEETLAQLRRRDAESK